MTPISLFLFFVDTVYQASLKGVLRQKYQSSTEVIYGRVINYSAELHPPSLGPSTLLSFEVLKVYKGTLSAGTHNIEDYFFTTTSCGTPAYAKLNGTTFLNFSEAFSTSKDLNLRPGIPSDDNIQGFVVKDGHIYNQNFPGVSLSLKEFETMMKTSSVKAFNPGQKSLNRPIFLSTSQLRLDFKKPNRSLKVFDLKGHEIHQQFTHGQDHVILQAQKFSKGVYFYAKGD